MNKLKKVNPEEYGLEEKKANQMVSGLNVTIEERQILENAYIDVIDLEITEENIVTFKELRLKIRNNRTQGIEKWHKTNKAFYLAGGRFVDAIKNRESSINEQMESKLLEAEKHFENLEKERVLKLQQDRANELIKYSEDAFERELSSMDEDVWVSFLATKKQQHEDIVKAEKIREEERLENERIEKLRFKRSDELRPFYNQISSEDEKLNLGKLTDNEFASYKKRLLVLKNEDEYKREKQRVENERLKKEAKKIRDEIAKEKALSELKAKKLEEENQAKLKKEREAKEKLEAELKVKKEAEQKAENERVQAELKAKKDAEKKAKAPIKKQLSIWVETFELPHLRTENKKANEIKQKFESFKVWAKSEIDNL